MNMHPCAKNNGQNSVYDTLEEKNREIEKYVYDMKEKNTPENIQSFTFKKEKRGEKTS